MSASVVVTPKAFPASVTGPSGPFPGIEAREIVRLLEARYPTTMPIFRNCNWGLDANGTPRLAIDSIPASPNTSLSRGWINQAAADLAAALRLTATVTTGASAPWDSVTFS